MDGNRDVFETENGSSFSFGVGFPLLTIRPMEILAEETDLPCCRTTCGRPMIQAETFECVFIAAGRFITFDSPVSFGSPMINVGVFGLVS